jgi:hypothetical protein
MAINMEKIGIFAEMSDNVLVPDFGQQRTARLVQWPILPFGFLGRRNPR